MQQPQRIKVEDALKELETFCDDKHTIVMATVNEDAQPFVSYAPYVEDEDKNYYVYLSGYVPHAHNMYKTKKASIMMIEDESKCANYFGRKRLYFQVDVEKFEENDERAEKINELFTKKFGENVKFLQKMPDFRIYKLIPQQIDFVLGFGSAYKVSKDRQSLKLKNAVHEETHEKHV